MHPTLQTSELHVQDSKYAPLTLLKQYLPVFDIFYGALPMFLSCRQVSVTLVSFNCVGIIMFVQVKDQQQRERGETMMKQHEYDERIIAF